MQRVHAHANIVVVVPVIGAAASGVVWLLLLLRLFLPTSVAPVAGSDGPVTVPVPVRVFASYSAVFVRIDVYVIALRNTVTGRRWMNAVQQYRTSSVATIMLSTDRAHCGLVSFT